MNQIPSGHSWPACVGVDEAARILGWPVYFFAPLIRAGHIKPLGKPAQNGRKWFATVELQRLGQDAAWLDKAIRIVERYVHDSNEKQRGKVVLPASPREDTALSALN